MKFEWGGVQWGTPSVEDITSPTGRRSEEGIYFYYFYWCNWIKNKKYRYLGPQYMYYDGAHRSFGFWFFNVAWSTQWTMPEKGD